MQSQTALSWLRRHRRVVAIIVAFALAFAIVATLVATPTGFAEDVSQSGAETTVQDVELAGASWSYYFQDDGHWLRGTSGPSWS